MTERVIQGFFLGGVRQGPGSPAAQAALLQPKGAAHGARQMPGPPPPAFAPTARHAVQQHRAPGATVQRPGGDGDFAVDPMRLGLSRGGGSPLPQILLAKMEAAFGADFSAVRVHVGPQPARIGALAFTTGNDLYFAPGQYQPDSVRGQQLIGHELAHVVQQRAGRVRGAGNGTWVVQNRALEAEADRLGARAAAHVVQPKRVPGVPSPRAIGPEPSAALQMRRAQGRQPPVNRNPGNQRAMARQNNHNQRRLAAGQLQQALRGGARVRGLRGAARRVARVMLAGAPAPVAAPQQVVAAQQAAAPQPLAPLPFAAAPRLLDPQEAAARRREQARQDAREYQEGLDQFMAIGLQRELDLEAELALEVELRRQVLLAQRGVEEEALLAISGFMQQAEEGAAQWAGKVGNIRAEFMRPRTHPELAEFLRKHGSILFSEIQIAKVLHLSRKNQLKSAQTKGWDDVLTRIYAINLEEHKHAVAGSFGSSGGLNAKGGTISGHREAEFEAGSGKRWHVHYDHVKFNDNNRTRINFAKRKKADILASLNAAVVANPGLAQGDNAASLAQCVAWIDDNC